MNEQLISFETAKLAKEKGFSEYGNYFYTEEDGLCSIDSDGEILNIYDKNLNQTDYHYDCNGDFWFDEIKEEFYLPEKYLAPTQSLLQKWLREKHDILVFPYINFQEKDYFYCSIFPKNGDRFSTEDFLTYEEALEDGLQEALKLI